MFLFPIAFSLSVLAADTGKDVRLGTAACSLHDSTIVINTGRMVRVYTVTGNGLKTTRLTIGAKRPATDGSEGFISGENTADWNLGLTGQAEWLGTTINTGDDSGLTSPYIAVVSEFDYPQAGVRLRHTVWAYPGSGIRTQLELKADAHPIADAVLSRDDQQIESVPVPHPIRSITAFGYYNDTQNRDEDTTFILKDARSPFTPGTSVDWASGLVTDRGGAGWIVVKESHKCVNQPGVWTGNFTLGPGSILITGAGMGPQDLSRDAFKLAWATWIIPYTGDTTDALLALKAFDRQRYPVHPGDVYMMANTWGYSKTPADGQYAAREESILQEIASQADLGIDVQQIDDGWQGSHYNQWKPAVSAIAVLSGKGPGPFRYDVYPDGWGRVKTFAQQQHVALGLWAAWTIPEEDLRWNYDHGGFHYVKLDFSNLNTKTKLDDFMAKVRRFVRYTGNTVRINWDATENAPRMGYFYGREYGNIYLENRKPAIPGNVVYHPYLVLRDAWQLSKYMNLRDFQLSVMDPDTVARDKSDAYGYSHAYCTAITLMGSPLFFGLTHCYANEARAEVKHLLGVYKRHRDSLAAGYVFPVGEIPDNASWTGFQDVLPGRAAGYLLVFRERLNKKPSLALDLAFLRNTDLELTDLESGQVSRIHVNARGAATFFIERPASYRFYRYKILKHNHQTP